MEILLKTWLNIANLPKSSFHEWVNKLNQTNEEELQLINIIKNIFEESSKTYGYRRITIALRKKVIIVNHKKVYRIMKENGCTCIKFTRRGRRYSSFKGEIGKIAENKFTR